MCQTSDVVLMLSSQIFGFQLVIRSEIMLQGWSFLLRRDLEDEKKEGKRERDKER